MRRKLFCLLISTSIVTSIYSQSKFNLDSIPPLYASVNKPLIVDIVTQEKNLSLVTVREDLTKYNISLQNNQIKYTAKPGDYFEFLFGIKHNNKVDTFSIKPVISLTPTYSFVQNGVGYIPSKNYYIDVNQTISKQEKLFNHELQKTRKINITGLTITLDQNSQIVTQLKHDPATKYCDADIEAVSIFCDTLILKTKLWLPQTQVTIYCQTLIFNSPATNDLTKDNIGFIRTQPLDFKLHKKQNEVAANGENGDSAGRISIFAKSIINNAGDQIVFASTGGKGQNGGPGADGTNHNQEAVGFTVTLPRRYFALWPSYCDPHTETNVIYETLIRVDLGSRFTPQLDQGAINQGFRVTPSYYIKGDPNTRLKPGDDATKPGYAGLGGVPGNINITSETQLNTSLFETKMGTIGSYFGESKDGLKYAGGLGQEATILTQDGSPYHINDCDIEGGFIPFKNGHDRKLRQLNGEIGESFPPSKDQEWKKEYTAYTAGGDPVSESKYYIEKIYFKNLIDSARALATKLETNKVSYIKPSHNEWLHPNYVSKQLEFIREIYLNGNLELSNKLLLTLQNAITKAISDTTNEFFIELSSQLITTNTVLNRIASNLDYFGNPAGYCPLLSLWVNKMLYENAVEKSVNDIILCREIQDIQVGNSIKVNDMRQLISGAQQQIASYYSDLDDYNLKMDNLINKMNSIANQIKTLEPKLKNKEQELLQMAQTNVKKAHEVPFFKKAIGVLATACKVIPIYQPALGAIGEGLDLVNNLDTKQPLANLSAAKDVYSQFSSATFAKSKEDFDSKISEFKKGDKDLLTYGKDLYNNYNTNYAPAIQNIINASRDSKIDANEIYAALEDIKSQDKEFQDLTEEIKDLTDKKVQMNTDISEVTNKLSTIQSNISEQLVILSKLKNSVDKLSNEGISVETMDLLKKIETQSFERLLQYHYYLAKSYEYRMLEPYPNRLSFVNEFAELTKNLDSTGSVSKEDKINAIKLIYRRAADEVMDRFIAKLQNEKFQHQKAKVSIQLTKTELDSLNNNGKVIVNLANRYIAFGRVTTQANRILYNITLQKPEVKVNDETTGNVIITLSILNNESITDYKANNYKFFMGNKITPLFTSTLNIDPSSSNILTRVDNSYDVEEFLQMTGISKKTNGDSLYESYYTRPLLETEVYIENNSAIPVKFNTLKFDLDYGFIPQQNIKYIQITGCENLLPLIVVEDNSSKKIFYYKNNFTKAFKADEKINVICQPLIGKRKFDHWEDYLGKVVSKSNSYQVPLDDSYVIIKPVYK